MTTEHPVHWEPSVQDIVSRLADQPGALLPILHAIQDALGYVPEAAVPSIAQALHLSRAEVHGVISFYHYFRTTPPGKHTVRICRAESCQSMGAAALEAHAKQRLGIDYHATTADGQVSLEPYYCLGACACSPAIMIDQDVHARVTPQRFDSLMDALQEKVDG